MKKVIKAIFNQWAALLCVVFIGYMLLIAGEERINLLFAFGLPIFVGVIYLATLVFSGGEEDEATKKDDLITRIGSYWLKLTLPKKKNPARKSLKSRASEFFKL